MTTRELKKFETAKTTVHELLERMKNDPSSFSEDEIREIASNRTIELGGIALRLIAERKLGELLIEIESRED